MSMSLLLGWGAYARDKNTSARLCAKKRRGAGGGLMREGGLFAGHYGNKTNIAFLRCWISSLLLPLEW